MKTQKIVVMGVSGCGKSTIGQRLADELQLPFFDGDDYHPANNRQKMSQGIPLTDDDRTDWLGDLARLMRDKRHGVIACSALKQAYRDLLRAGNPDLVFVYLQGSFDTIWDRMKARSNHYFKGSDMLRSQFHTLEEPSPVDAVWVDIRHDPDWVVDDILTRIDD